MKVLCLRTCVDSSIPRPYHETEIYNVNDATIERWREETILQHFGDPETGEPLLVLPPRPQFIPTMGIAKDADVLANKILGDVEKKAADILAEAEAQAAKIIEDAVAASAPDDKKGLVEKIKDVVTGGSPKEDEQPSEESTEPKAE